MAGCEPLLTGQPEPGDGFESPLDDLPGDLLAMFGAGDENFSRAFGAGSGLGPIFNNVSCVACHPGDGRGTPREILVRFSLGSDPLHHLGGPQLQDRAIPGQRPERLPPAAETSPRMPPPVFGMGLIEAIPADSILAREDPSDADGDGISGRANRVLAAEFVPESEVGGGAGTQLGRFGRKAGVSSLLEQVATAYHQDIGITSDFLPSENAHPQAGGGGAGDRVSDPEIPAATVLETTMYVRLLAPPARGPLTPSVLAGEGLFASTGCASCHVPAFRTGPHAIAPLHEAEVRLYSDLLLHDMGPELADSRPEGDADGFEWRTPPLWGTRLVSEFLNGEAFYLHDGRARSLEEAIRLHGGEAQASREAFEALPPADRAALLDFLESL